MYAKPERLPTRIVSLAGDARDVEIFLGPARTRGAVTETLGERLNSHLQFLPVALGEKVELLQVDHIVEVEVDGSIQDVEQLESFGATRAPVTVHLSNGTSRCGDLVYVAPRETRISDALNSTRDQFLLLVVDGRCHYLNRKAVIRVEA